jgi:lipid II isoglutaminyl synthase (glutamine-hydrolysing)
MLADVLETSGASVIHNRSGSNLVRGIVATFADHSSPFGSPRGDVAVIESDEAALPQIISLLKPHVVVLNNLFRDQLDRYGELNTVARLWRNAFERLDSTTTLVVNADDPTLAAITEGIEATRVTFGLDNETYRLETLPHAADAAVCPHCQQDLVYDALYVAHMGAWRCPHCGWSHPPLDFVGTDIRLEGVEALNVVVRGDDTMDLRLRVEVPGLYNVYNVVAAAAAAKVTGVRDADIKRALEGFRSAFGRIERFELLGRRFTMVLAKNPVGFNEVIRMLTTEQGALTVPTMIAINDLSADGRDVSWLWDVDFELLAGGEAPLSTTGLRGADMANRLQYASVDRGRIRALPDDLREGLFAFARSIPEGGSGYILTTYTAMLGLREILADEGVVEAFWRQ